MSRMVVFNQAARSSGEINGMFSRGWTITGHPNVRAGGATSIVLSTAEAGANWLQFGRLAVIRQANLPDWVGVIDPEWNGIMPVQAALQNAEYLFALRSPDKPAALHGSTAEIVGQMLTLINEQGPTPLKLGITDKDQDRDETLDRRSYWDQLKALIERAGMEMILRPEVVDGRLSILVDVRTQIGKNTNFEFTDGEGGNMAVVSAKVTQQIWNRVIAYNDGSSEESRIQTEPFDDDASIARYGLRSKNLQVRGVITITTLERYAKTYLALYSRPKLDMTMLVKNKGSAFGNARLGNTAIFHAANIHLPGNVHGWRGTARILAMAYNESNDTLGMTVSGRYE